MGFDSSRIAAALHIGEGVVSAKVGKVSILLGRDEASEATRVGTIHVQVLDKARGWVNIGVELKVVEE